LYKIFFFRDWVPFLTLHFVHKVSPIELHFVPFLLQIVYPIAAILFILTPGEDLPDGIQGDAGKMV